MPPSPPEDPTIPIAHPPLFPNLALALPVLVWRHAIIPLLAHCRHHLYICTAITAAVIPLSPCHCCQRTSLTSYASSLVTLANADANVVIGNPWIWQCWCQSHCPMFFCCCRRPMPNAAAQRHLPTLLHGCHLPTPLSMAHKRGGRDSNKPRKASTKQEIKGDPTRELPTPARQYQGARLVHHNGRSLTTGGFLMGGPSVGARKDWIFGRKYHGGDLVIWSPTKPRMSVGLVQLFWIPT